MVSGHKGLRAYVEIASGEEYLIQPHQIIIVILFGSMCFIEVQLFELVDLIFQFLKRTAFIAS
jgi:hypothetical protein